MQLGYAGTRDIRSWGISAGGGEMQLGKPTHEVQATEVYQHTGDIQLRCTGTRGVGRCMQPAYASTHRMPTHRTSA